MITQFSHSFHKTDEFSRRFFLFIVLCGQAVAYSKIDVGIFTRTIFIRLAKNQYEILV